MIHGCMCRMKGSGRCYKHKPVEDWCVNCRMFVRDQARLAITGGAPPKWMKRYIELLECAMKGTMEEYILYQTNDTLRGMRARLGKQ